MNILKALDQLEKIEMRIGHLYEWFSENLKDDPEAAAFFYRMSIDESAHANLVKYQRRLVSRNMKLFGSLEIDLDGVQKEIARVEAILSGEPLPAEAAVKIALEIENSAAETHYRSAIEKAESGIANLLGSLNFLDCKHVGVFEAFAAGRGYSFAPANVKISEIHAGPPLKAPEAAGGEQSEISGEMLEKIEHYHKWIETMDFYEILGVKDYASDEQIRHAFRLRAIEFHPDKHMHIAEDTRQKLSAIFACMTNAYATLMSPDKRNEYNNTRSRRTRH
ncbi:MAG: DnaJ domain-containing protein [Nitrospirae bacterium]|nr:DnaJ domain-containing protein [Nitrospirota bacterium]